MVAVVVATAALAAIVVGSGGSGIRGDGWGLAVVAVAGAVAREVFVLTVARAMGVVVVVAGSAVVVAEVRTVAEVMAFGVTVVLAVAQAVAVAGGAVRSSVSVGGGIPSLDAEGIACAPILEEHVALLGQSAKAIALLEENGPFCNTFRIDMVTVWNILFEMFGQMPAWLHAASTKKEKNGHKLYRLLFAHYIGSDHVNHLANKMEARLANLTYRGEQKNWDWSRYTNAHIEQQTIAKNLMEHGYSGLDECSKVRHLLTGIQDNAVHPVVC